MWLPHLVDNFSCKVQTNETLSKVLFKYLFSDWMPTSIYRSGFSRDHYSVRPSPFLSIFTPLTPINTVLVLLLTTRDITVAAKVTVKHSGTWVSENNSHLMPLDTPELYLARVIEWPSGGYSAGGCLINPGETMAHGYLNLGWLVYQSTGHCFRYQCYK